MDIYNSNLRVCYYARVSTLNEMQYSSIVNQVDYFSKYIKSIPNWHFVGGYVDYGISGKSVAKRSEFKKMIDDAKRGGFNLILTKSVSRFARNTIDSIRYTDLLLQYGVGVFFISDNINTFSSDSEFRLTLMSSIAQDEIRKLSESVRFGLSQSIKRGVVLGNNNILGYRKKAGKLIIDEDEARMIRDIFSWFISSKYNYREVSELLYKKYNKKLDATGIRRVLSNYKYKGFYCGRKSSVINYKTSRRKYFDKSKWLIYKDYENIPPIIKEDIWNKAQIIINKRKKNKNKRLKVICKNHNREFICKKKRYKDKIYVYYKCHDCSCFTEEFLNKVLSPNKYYSIIIEKRSDDFLVNILEKFC